MNQVRHNPVYLLPRVDLPVRIFFIVRTVTRYRPMKRVPCFAGNSRTVTASAWMNFLRRLALFLQLYIRLHFLSPDCFFNQLRAPSLGSASI
jgi:hypothetical protein